MSIRRVSSSFAEGEEDLKSPRKLQRSIWNQLLPPAGGSRPSSTLSLRSIDLTPTLPSVLLQCEPYASHINALDVSYSFVDGEAIAALCGSLRCLEEVFAVNCGLVELESSTKWPSSLKLIDLSRNRLTAFPLGIDSLMHLEKLNLSGNFISNVEPSVLKLPKLENLYLLKNPIANIPKNVCREGVLGMRRYFNVQPHPLPETRSRESPPVRTFSLRKALLQQTESTESGYDSSGRLASSSSYSSLNDIEQEIDLWPRFHPDVLPEGYTEACQGTLCQIYLPEGCRKDVRFEIVKDISLHPKLRHNEFLMTPVVRITPHGLAFDLNEPAIVVLSHCMKLSGGIQQLVQPLCSSTVLYEPPNWMRIDGDKCEVFNDCVMFHTTHFSLFAVISVLPYPSASIEISPNEGGTLPVLELPGFQIQIPPNSIGSTTTITATVYYVDRPYCPEEDNPLALASVCVGLEPHGMEFKHPVEVSIPIPDYAAIKSTFHDASLHLWYSPYINEGVFQWETVDNTPITVHDGLHGHIAVFKVEHFSFFELLWSVCKDTLVRLGYGASFVYRQLSSRTRYVSVRCQVFMSPPLQDLTFGLLVMVYKFGDPLKDLSNYRWMLADTGGKHVFVKTGDISVTLEGHFSPRSEFGETGLSRTATIDFSGQDFCLRFEFALGLRELWLPLQDHQIIGKMRVGQWDGTTPIDINLIKVLYVHIRYQLV